MTDASVRVPEISTKHDGREVDCEVIVRNGINYYKQRTNAHAHYLDVTTGIYTPQNGAIGIPFVMDYQNAIARSLVPGAYPLNSFGERTSTVAETNFPVWPDGVFNIPAVAGVQMSFVSTSAADSSAGANIRTMELHYLDANLLEKTETIILNGLTPVLTIATNIRFIQCLHVATFGTNYNAAGIITASNAGIIYSQIAIGESRCTSSFRMVPAGKKLYIDGLIGSSISGTAAARTIIKFVASELDNRQYISPLILLPQASIGVQDNSAIFSMPPQPGYNAGSVVGFTHTSDKAATISASFFGRLENL